MTAFDARPLVYVAGPYAHPDPVINTREAILTGDRLNAGGLVTAHVPHLTHTWHIVAPHEPDHWYAYDFAVLRRCDAVLRMPGASTGADNEVEYAVEHHIPVFFDEDHLAGWAFVRLSEMEPC